MCLQRPSSGLRKASPAAAVAEREVEVVAADGDQIDLRAIGACSECQGCGGRCDWFASAAGRDRLQLTRGDFPSAPRPGQRWRLGIDDRELLRQSWLGYGSLLAGLIGGAGIAHGAATIAGIATDTLTTAGALAGTLLALRLSKRARTGRARSIQVIALHPGSAAQAGDFP
jgi:positive regulator of sigma E activity